MKVKYAYDKGDLIKDNYYTFIREDYELGGEAYYVVIGDKGLETWDWAIRFYNIDEVRDSKLNELLK